MFTWKMYRMMIIKIPLVILPILVVQFSSCISNYTMQTARVIPENKWELGGVVAEVTDFAASDMQNTYDKNSHKRMMLGVDFPLSFAFSARFPLGKNKDMGILFNPLVKYSPSEIGGDIKYQFVDTGLFCMATGLGTFYYNDYLYMSREDGAMYLDGFLPVYASVHLGNEFALYSAVKGVGRFRRNHESKLDSRVRNRYTALVSPAAGFEVVEGGKIIRTEACYQYEFKTRFYSYQFNIGIFHRFNFGGDSSK